MTTKKVTLPNTYNQRDLVRNKSTHHVDLVELVQLWPHCHWGLQSKDLQLELKDQHYQFAWQMQQVTRITNQQQLMATFGIGDTSKGKNRKKATKAQQDRQREDDWEDSSPLLSSEESSDMDDSDEDYGSNDERAEHRALAHKKERRHREDLHAEALDAQKILNGGTKLTTLKTCELYQPWTRQSKISSDATADTFRGMRLIQFHTFEWSIKSVASRQSCVGICEEVPLQSDSLWRRIPPHIVLHFMVASSPRLVNFTWPDGLEVDQRALTEVERSFDLGSELAAHKRDVMCLGQSYQLQAIIDTVQKSQIAWEDTTGAVNIQKQPPLRPLVQHALENMVKGQPSKSKKQASHDEVPFSESLAVSYWSSNMEEVIDTSVMKNEKFVILSSHEDDLHLVEEAKVHECKQKLVDRSEDDRKVMMDTGDSTSGGNKNSYKTISDGGVYDSHRIAVRSEDLDDRENEERVFDEGGVVKLDDGECRDNAETDVGDNQGINEGHTPTSLHDPAKPDCPISLDLNDEEGETSDINGSQILKDICMDAPPGSPFTQQPICVSDDLGPQAAISGSAMVKKPQKCGHSSLTLSNESCHKGPGSSHDSRRKQRQLCDIGHSVFMQFQGMDDLASQLG
ncbi:hypothetical protein DEU56DRAFT_754125 [Suillus clintonianus]|uniref:uncharacterized protein n=1 Tax=Suillus clintonianus TaxID=1904413 RepID=UPI001B875801|nr:uncharacterized protein DEU56DRAFT_754125 [Suillus clintonianus]KAG2145267.1 hypothetical protein DEU56DRAFT_754125 [Suillus clintonianus]